MDPPGPACLPVSHSGESEESTVLQTNKAVPVEDSESTRTVCHAPVPFRHEEPDRRFVFSAVGGGHGLVGLQSLVSTCEPLPWALHVFV